MLFIRQSTYSQNTTKLGLTIEKLNQNNYLAWSGSIELWFLGEGHYSQWKKSFDKIPRKHCSEWKRLDY